MNNKEQMLKLIIRLTELTNEKKIQWKIDSNFNRITFPDEKITNVFVSELEGKTLRLYCIEKQILNSTFTFQSSGMNDKKEKIKLEMEDNNICVEFPDSIDLLYLYDAVKKTITDVSTWIDNIFKKY